MSFDNSDDDVVTIKEYCEEEQKRQEKVIAVLGAGDENKCSYTLGYLERQALFSCDTCQPLKRNPGGICYGCAVHCHRGHDLVELYTKRNFRCDCGNSKFDDFKCSLYEEKEALNEKNNYNHNFMGKYCKCERPYPDPDDEIEDEMLQCMMCEDWYHSRHLGCLAPADYGEMVCDKCVKLHPFLQFYKDFAVPPVTVISQSKDTNKDEVDVISTNDNSKAAHNGLENNELKDSSHNNDNFTKEETHLSQNCILKMMKKKHLTIDSLVAMFFEDGWRKELCHCKTCVAMYNEEGIDYVLKETDTIVSYEEKGKENVEKYWEEAASTITSLNKVQQVELLHGYHELKSGLQDFVRGFDEGQVIRKADVESFFENLNAQKRRRMDNSL